ncbi:MAG: hypothetical protein F6J89_09725 [Symploca sp. SIO1C4]|uniref:Isopropylmalate/homocitrate/citramalate synthase n=1 Tax=Symploca sp. SIO1C4 TaxID=2607765 RepID=A0A6B3NCV2_9CYAN|nr:hypothetical protein [Symploca sp. SIO1C4]NET06456.1 hypothetical protein [Symploca sp. SIO2B6]NET51218.1 hypothetical protein [Merismopedia sp. SIO2A8]
MTHSDQSKKNTFLYPHSRYRGPFRLEYLAFNANLQEFSHRASYISGLLSAGKLSPDQAYKDLKNLWKQLKRSKKAMGIGTEAQESKD